MILLSLFVFYVIIFNICVIIKNCGHLYKLIFWNFLFNQNFKELKYIGYSIKT